MNKKEKILGILPRYAPIPLICACAFNCIIYSGLMFLMGPDVKRYDFTNDFDRMVPFIPAFASIYLLCYIFWVVNYCMIGSISKEHLYRFLVGDMLSRVVCGICFVLIPTTNVRPEITGTGFWDNVMKFICTIDQPENLFPSIHCLASWFCYLGIKNQKKIPKWYQITSLGIALLICISTQVTKQHYIVDMIGGILLSYICFAIGQKTDWYKKLEKIFTAINRKFHMEI